MVFNDRGRHQDASGFLKNFGKYVVVLEMLGSGEFGFSLSSCPESLLETQQIQLHRSSHEKVMLSPSASSPTPSRAI